MIEVARKIVEYAFRNKADLAGKPYMGHLNRLEEKLKNKNEEIRTVALLHDLLEDCPDWNKEVLKCFFWSSVVNAVDAMTKRKGEKYEDYINRVQSNRYATVVKIADLEDNMDITRLKELTDKDVVRLKKYLIGYHFLTGNNDPIT
ncbi:MAG: (p)ppGpp synthase/HD superfamily hydrolase [Polaribacter sp.]|jgi:(p)ppGpp synthase/HD superfamily hydrolase